MPTAAASHVGADENSLVTPEIENGPTEAATIPSNEATVSPSTNIMSTPAPTVQPVADSSSSNSIEAVWTTSPYSDEQISPEHYVIHTMYEDDLRYRRVCAPIGEHANVCLTIRYPFEIPKQDPSVTYPKPVSAVFDDPDFALPLHIIDGMEPSSKIMKTHQNPCPCPWRSSDVLITITINRLVPNTAQPLHAGHMSERESFTFTGSSLPNVS